MLREYLKKLKIAQAMCVKKINIFSTDHLITILPSRYFKLFELNIFLMIIDLFLKALIRLNFLN